MQTIPRFAQIKGNCMISHSCWKKNKKHLVFWCASIFTDISIWTIILISAEHVYFPGHQGRLFKLTPIDLDLLPQLFQRPDVESFGAKKGMKLEWHRWVFMCQGSSKTTCQVSRLHSLQQKEKTWKMVLSAWRPVGMSCFKVPCQLSLGI